MKLFVQGQFPKLACLPMLPWRAWWALWLAAFTTMLVHWAGARLDWWAFDETWGAFAPLLFVLLGFTPVDMSRRIVFMICKAGDANHGPFVPVSRWKAWRLRRDPDVEVHRVIVERGKVVHGERIT